MTITPLSAIADALIEFILSLLRDPAEAAKFAADPERSLQRAGLQNVCADDVRAVMPVVVEHPHVVPKPVQQAPVVIKVHEAAHRDPEVIKQITTVTHSYHIENRSTVVDQSTNQNIWAHGDVTQTFDQEAVLGVGDHSVAVGDDALIDDSQTNLTTGDISIGNTTTEVAIDDSFNDESTQATHTAITALVDSHNDHSNTETTTTRVADSLNASVTTDVDVENSGHGTATGVVAAPTPAEPVDPGLPEPDDDPYQHTAVDLEPPLDDDFDHS